MASAKIAVLQSMRGIAATAIFIHHVGFETSANVSAGVFAVMFFFALSGYLMSSHYAAKASSPDFKFWPYIRKKIVKLYPFNILCAFLAIPFMLWHTRPDIIAGITANLLMIQGWMFNPTVTLACNGPAWTQSVVMFFYIIFPWLACRLTSSPKAFVRSVSFILVAYVAAIPFIPDSLNQELIYFFPLLRMPDFMLGMMLWVISTTIPVPDSNRQNWAEIFAVAVVVLFFITNIHAPACYAEVCWWWIPAAVLLLTFGRGSENPGIVSRILSVRPLVFIGNHSFCFYLLHYPMICLVRRLCSEAALDLPLWLMAIVIYTLTIGLSIPARKLFLEKLPRMAIA